MSGSRWETWEPKDAVIPPTNLRQSLLTLMDKCQGAGYLYVKHDGGLPSHPMFRGSVFHETVERCCRTMQQIGEVRIAPDDAKAVLAEVLEDHPEWVVPASEMDALRVMVHHWAESFEMPFGAQVEVPFKLQVGDKTVTGTIDLLWVAGDTLYIRDYKSGFGLYRQDEVSGKDGDDGEKKQRGARAAQLIIYTLGAADGVLEGFKVPPGVNRFDCAFVFPMWTSDTGMFERGVTIERPELIEHREWLHGLVRKSNARFVEGRYTVVPGSHCARCPSNTECPLPARTRMGSPFERDPRAVAEDLYFMEQDSKTLKQELKAYCEQFGEIPVGIDVSLGFVPVSGKRPTVRFGFKKRAA